MIFPVFVNNLALFGSALVLGSGCCPLPGVGVVSSFYMVNNNNNNNM